MSAPIESIHPHALRSATDRFIGGRCVQRSVSNSRADTHRTLAATEETSLLTLLRLDAAVPMLTWKRRGLQMCSSQRRAGRRRLRKNKRARGNPQQRAQKHHKRRRDASDGSSSLISNWDDGGGGAISSGVIIFTRGTGGGGLREELCLHLSRHPHVPCVI